MSQIPAFLLLLWIAAFASFVSSAKGDDDIGQDREQQLDWSGISENANQLRVTHGDGIVSMTTAGTDPYFFFDLPRLSRSDRDWMLEVETFCPEGVQGLEWRSGRSIHRAQSIALPRIERSEGWTTYKLNLTKTAPNAVADAADAEVSVRIDLGNVPGVRLQVRKVSV
jgi:hypothetical protein